MSELVGRMPPQQLQHLLRTITPRGPRGSRVQRGQLRLRIALQAMNLEGKLSWSGPSGPDSKGRIDTHGGENQFAIWMRGGPRPTDTSGMNCWEMVLYAAYSANAITEEWLRTIHRLATGAYRSESSPDEKQDAYYRVLSEALGYSRAFPVKNGVPIPAGHIVFFNGIEHVALSKGTLNDHGQHEIVSLWCVPRKNDSVQQTTIERLVQSGKDSGDPESEIKHAPPPWG